MFPYFKAEDTKAQKKETACPQLHVYLSSRTWDWTPTHSLVASANYNL